MMKPTHNLNARPRNYEAALRERARKGLAELENELRTWLANANERVDDVEQVCDALRLQRDRIKHD